MEITKNKKAVFFTFIAILLVGVMMLIFNPNSEISFNKDIPAIKTRVTKINDFIDDFENVYLPAAIKNSGSRALTSLTYYMRTQGFLTDFQTDFKEVIQNGTLGGNQIDEIIEANAIPGEEGLMINNTLTYWANRLETIAEAALNIDLYDYNVVGVTIEQTTPWFVNINLEISYSISSETASWTRNNIVIPTKLALDDLYDPIYYVNTNGAYKKNITQTDIMFNDWNKGNLTKFIEDETYFHWQNSNAPNFLTRFTEDFSSSTCCGIESAVNPDKLAVQESRVYLDYLFFDSSIASCSDPDKLYTVNGISGNFKLDFQDVVKYNVIGDVSELLCS
ncbi:hypothetical protein ISS05_03040 [Candidatus Woesearchaeota archaeon]|nr:hypothetical protein [Candidatus Woesearchaeota archaeon]